MEWNEPIRQKGFEKKLNRVCEINEPKTWPHGNRKQGAFLIPFMEDPVHLGIVTRQDKTLLSSAIFFPGGDAITSNPRTTMLEQASQFMGVDPKSIQVTGYLGLYPFPNADYDAHIFVGWTQPMEEWKLDPEMVDKAYKIPFEYFMEKYTSPS
ncbi:MAG: hypothetical protein D6785_16625, partial [Planctomycetota bacterium]